MVGEGGAGCGGAGGARGRGGEGIADVLGTSRGRAGATSVRPRGPQVSQRARQQQLEQELEPEQRLPKPEQHQQQARKAEQEQRLSQAFAPGGESSVGWGVAGRTADCRLSFWHPWPVR